MKQEIHSEFHKFVVDRVGYYEARYLHLQMGLPSDPITKAYKTPEKTPHKILIAFAQVLNLSPYELIKTYHLGKARISPIEQQYHKKIYDELENSNFLSTETN